MATKKYYRVPGCPMALSLATHPGELTVDDVQENIVRALENSQEQAKREQSEGYKGDCWVWNLEHNYLRGDQGYLPWSMQTIERGPTEEDWKRAEDESEMWTMAARLTGEPGNYVMDPAEEEKGGFLKQAAGVGEALEEIGDPEDAAELEEVLSMTIDQMTEAFP